MPFDRIFADGTAFDIAEGQGEFTRGEIYLIDDTSPRVRYATGESASEALYGTGMNAYFNALDVETVLGVTGDIHLHGQLIET